MFIWWWPGFPPLICIHLHMSTNKKTGSATAETLIRQWPELKLRWGTQTLPQQYRIHPLPGGICSGGCLLLGGGMPACTEADPPVDRITDMSKNNLDHNFIAAGNKHVLRILSTGGEVYTPRADTTHTPWADLRGRHITPPDGHCSGGYASYWNAFLFRIKSRTFIDLHVWLLRVS